MDCVCDYQQQEDNPRKDKKLLNLTASGALSSLTRMDLWQVAGIMLIIFRPGLISVANMVSLQTRARRTKKLIASL